MTRGSEERREFTVTGKLMSEAANHEGGGRAIASEARSIRRRSGLIAR